MLDGSPQTGLHDFVIEYLRDRDVETHLGAPCRDIVHGVDEDGKPTRVTGLRIGVDDELRGFDAVPGIQNALLKSFRKYPVFDDIYDLDCVPIATVQVRFHGWLTEMNDDVKMTDNEYHRRPVRRKGSQDRQPSVQCRRQVLLLYQ